ncbi:hypothetical protein [Kitasatospora sp. NPDC094015]|uniref:hypothetical protein n=1 Tax=Kitasatospora sp. NPDC094015 TaxID=3155205 RepID=UPI00331E0913
MISVVVLLATASASLAPLVAGLLVQRLSGTGALAVCAGVAGAAAVAALGLRALR